ncbi:MAG: glutamate--tRNA ligase [bacterium]|nr:glutamate--tRNA ligase [Acidimicrobiia bacterium]MCY4651419.1 glutamate--tRNA ligase [bacterium]
MTPRLRVAPSPTGLLHVGTARAALFNWLYARRHGGVFIVRVDDTDRRRSTSEFEEKILEGLRWLGLDWDEGVEVGGPHGEYRQSGRFERYREVGAQLVAKGAAYRCYCSPEELAQRRKEAQRAGRPPGYDGRCRSLDVPEAESVEGSYVVRFAMPRPGVTVFTDMVRGEVRFDHQVIDDFVILRSDGSPTYHLASTVDDVDYGITHVARGEDILPSTPRHIQLTRAMSAPEPVYAHLPLLHGQDGRKLSKRHGATDVGEYRQVGFLPEALFNYLSLLGWSIGPEATIFSPHQAVEAFDLADVSSSPAVFDPVKLEWMNGEYIRNHLSISEFAERARPYAEEFVGAPLADEVWQQAAAVLPLVQERVKLLSEVGPQLAFLLLEEIEYHPKSWRKVMRAQGVDGVLSQAISDLSKVADWRTEPIEQALRGLIAEMGISARKGFQPVRVAVTGSSISPPLFESLAAMGREATLKRLRDARSKLT